MRVLPALILAFMTGCAALGLEPAGVPAPPPARPSLAPAREASATFSASLIGRRKVDGLRVEVFVIGEGRVNGNLLSELKSPESRLRPPLMSVLIRHPKQGAVLFGAGLPEDMGGLGERKAKGSALSPFTTAPGRDILSRLNAAGVRVEDVRWVILPDLAPEWAGRAGAFPNATVVVSSRAWTNPRRRALERDMPDSRAFVPEERLALQDFSTRPAYGTFERGIDFFGDGTMELLDLDGGAAGGMGVWVNLDSGPLLLTGPAAFVYDNIFDSALPDAAFVVDLSSFAWNARAMRMAKEAIPRLVILPAYDVSTLKMSPRPDIKLVH
ncbi:MAG: hypothetical protein AAB036_10685 [Elusimicrobiota bacterium]